MSPILEQTAHRPYPLPNGRLIMTQRWNDLLFAHWPVAAELVQRNLPAGLEVETFDGSAWLGVVPFWMDRVRHHAPLPSGLHLSFEVPTASRFPELNLRTYARSRKTGKPGVFFHALECASPLAVLGARVLFHLPYFPARMDYRWQGDSMAYRSRRLLTRQPVEVALDYRPAGPVAEPAAPGSLAYFLTERYCLYTPFAGRLLRGEIHHAPWPLQPAEANFRLNRLPGAHGYSLPPVAPVLHFAKALEVCIWGLRQD
jgi:uncharacterized protein YqjF (DUF2071 family)